MSWYTWAETHPLIPCRACKSKGYTERDGAMRGCPKCRGLGSHACTMNAVRREYRKVRQLFCSERGMSPNEVDERVRKRVERLKFIGVNRAAIWFDVLFYMARDFGLLENYW